MSIINQLRIKEIFITVVAVIALSLAAAAQTENKNPAAKSEDFIEVVAKILSIDPVKGDVSVRLEFAPQGNLSKEDGTLARNVKFDVNSSNGKLEVSFEKGKRMPPTEALLNMYDGSVNDYPFDKHKAELLFFFTAKPEKKTEKKAEEDPDAEPKSETVDEEGETEVPFTLDFTPALAGYHIETTKSKDSDETFADIEMSISRSAMVEFFAVFVMILMLGVSIAVLLLTLSILLRGRKVEIAMFSFIATVIFAFVTLRNNLPGVPPVGTASDYFSFFWAIAILSLCLLTIIFTWVFRGAQK